jgi:hypothetical protein
MPGGVDRQNLRGVPAAVPNVWWADAPDRFSITEGVQIRKILDHIGVDSEPPHISPARGAPLWDDCDAQTDDGVHR